MIGSQPAPGAPWKAVAQVPDFEGIGPWQTPVLDSAGYATAAPLSQPGLVAAPDKLASPASDNSTRARDTTAESRTEWIAALDRLAALKPTAVVAGHKDPTQGNPPAILNESRGYIEYYGQLRQEAMPDQQLFDAMVNRYPSWVSRQQFLILGLN